MAEVRREIPRIRPLFFKENFASAAEWETDSKPAKAQGARAKMVKIPKAGRRF